MADPETPNSEARLTRHAEELADLVFQLLADCHQKEIRISERHGLTPAEFRFVRTFRKLESASNKDIAEKMGLTAGRLSRILDGLLRKHYVSRKEDPADRRNVLVTLTAKGKTLVESIEKDYVQAHAEILRRMQMPHESLVDGMSEFLTAVRQWLEKR
jgi:DNA-binding MarR family transcriptional regulator